MLIKTYFITVFYFCRAVISSPVFNLFSEIIPVELRRSKEKNPKTATFFAGGKRSRIDLRETNLKSD